MTKREVFENLLDKGAMEYSICDIQEIKGFAYSFSLKLEEKDKEIDRLNKECDAYMKIATKRGNIIEELEKEFEWQLKKQIDIDKFAEEQGFLNYNPVKLMVEHFKNKLKD